MEGNDGRLGDGAISAVVNTRNASRLLGETLASLTDFDEILVCDMESEDDTVEIARSYGARVVTFPKEGCSIVEPARNFALSQARGEWVLVVDADEVIPPALASWLREYVKSAHPADGLFIPRKNHLMGRWDRGTYPDYQLRFFRRQKCYWPEIVHSRPRISGTVDHIPSRRKDLAMLHASPSLSALFERYDRYSDDAAAAAFRHGRRGGWWELIIKPWWRFFKSFILHGGFRDGKWGYVAARNQSLYKYMAMAKLLEAESLGEGNGNKNGR